MDWAFSGDGSWSPQKSQNQRPEGFADRDREKDSVEIQKHGMMLTSDWKEANGRTKVGDRKKFGDDREEGNVVVIGDAGKIPVDLEVYPGFLKSKLNLACAAVALSRASFIIRQGSTPLDCSQASSKASQPGSQPLSKGHQLSTSLNKESSSLSAIHWFSEFRN